MAHAIDTRPYKLVHTISQNNFLTESLVMGVRWHTSLVGEQCGDSVRMVNIDTFGTKLSNPLESTEDKAVEDNLLDDSTIEVYPESKIESVGPHNQCFLPLIFRTKSHQGQSWKDLAKFCSNHSIRKDSVDNLHLEVHPNVTFRMQPCPFISSDNLGPLKVMIDSL